MFFQLCIKHLHNIIDPIGCSSSTSPVGQRSGLTTLVGSALRKLWTSRLRSLLRGPSRGNPQGGLGPFWIRPLLALWAMTATSVNCELPILISTRLVSFQYLPFPEAFKTTWNVKSLVIRLTWLFTNCNFDVFYFRNAPALLITLSPSRYARQRASKHPGENGVLRWWYVRVWRCGSPNSYQSGGQHAIISLARSFLASKPGSHCVSRLTSRNTANLSLIWTVRRQCF